MPMNNSRFIPLGGEDKQTRNRHYTDYEMGRDKDGHMTVTGSMPMFAGYVNKNGQPRPRPGIVTLDIDGACATDASGNLTVEPEGVDKPVKMMQSGQLFVNPVRLADHIATRDGSGIPKPVTVSTSFGTVMRSAGSSLAQFDKGDYVKSGIAGTAAQKYLASSSMRNPSRGIYTEKQIDAAAASVNGTLSGYMRDCQAGAEGTVKLSDIGLRFSESGPRPSLEVEDRKAFVEAWKDGSVAKFEKGFNERCAEAAGDIQDRKVAGLVKNMSIRVGMTSDGPIMNMYTHQSYTAYDLQRMDEALHEVDAYGMTKGFSDPSKVFGTKAVTNAARIISYGDPAWRGGLDELAWTMTMDGTWSVADQADLPASLDASTIKKVTPVKSGTGIEGVQDAAAALTGKFAQKNMKLLKGTGLGLDGEGRLAMLDEAKARTEEGYLAIRKFGLEANKFLEKNPLHVEGIALDGKDPVTGDFAPLITDLKLDRSTGGLSFENTYVGYEISAPSTPSAGISGGDEKNLVRDDEKNLVREDDAPQAGSAMSRLMEMAGQDDDYGEKQLEGDGPEF